MAGTAVFQSGTLATPGAGIVVATDAISGTQYQLVKLDAGTLGASVPVGYGGSGLPLGTLPGGSVSVVGTLQGLGTYQPLAGSVHVAAPVSGTVQVHGTIPIGTVAGTVSVLGTVRALINAGTIEALGTVQPLAGSVHLASRLPGTADIGTVAGTVSVLGTVRILDPAAVSQSGAWAVTVASGTVSLQTGGTVHVGSVQRVAGTVDVGTIAGTVGVLGTVQTVGVLSVIGTVQTHGTSQALGTLQPLAGSVHLASILPGGSVAVQGYAAHDAAAQGGPVLVGAFGSSGTQAAVGDGDAVRLWADLNGRLQIRGTIDSMPAISVTQGTIPGGTVQLHGTSEILGTVRALTTVNVTVGTIAEGTINSFTGTAQVLGTLQPLAGSVHVANAITGTVQTHGTSQVLGTVRTLAGSVQGQGFIGAGTLAAGNPTLIGAVGSSGTIAAVADGSTQYLWTDLSGRLQVRGTIDSIPAITITAGTVSLNTGGTIHVGSVQRIAGTVEALGTFQPLAGSVHLATNLAGGTVVSVGSAIHGAASDTRPHLIGAFGSSGTQAAVDDGDAIRLWADLNGRLQVRGTIDSIPAITITAGTVSLQTGGTLHVGSVQSVAGTVQVLGSVQAVGTVNIGTVQGTVQVRPAGVVGESFIGTIFTGAAFSTAAVLVNPASGTFVRLFDVLISGSAAGTVRLEFGSASGTLIAPLFLAANGGWSMNSTRGVRSPGTSKGLYVTASAGTWGVMINYALEN